MQAPSASIGRRCSSPHGPSGAFKGGRDSESAIFTLVGAGGVERSEEHVEHTTSLIESLDFRRGDFVFQLDENEVRDPTSDPDRLRQPCSKRRAEWSSVQQRERLKEALLASLKARGIKVLPYTLEKQWT